MIIKDARSKHALLACALLDAHRQVDRYLPSASLKNPSLVMVLELFATADLRKSLTVSDICRASGAPLTTALRHLQWLNEDGLVERENDPKDKRRVLVKLSRIGANGIWQWLNALDAAVPKLAPDLNSSERKAVAGAIEILCRLG